MSSVFCQFASDTLCASVVFNSTCGNATNQSTKGVRALCLTRARAFLPQTIGSEIRTAGSKERRTNTVDVHRFLDWKKGDNIDASSSEQAGHGPMEASVPTCQGSIVNSAANFPVQQSARPRSPTMSVGVPDTVLGFFLILVRQLSRKETIEVIETKGAMVSSETIRNEVQVARIAG